MAVSNTRTAIRYVLITPARNEATFLDAVITSVARQTLRPTKWVIVSDGSTDGTDELVSRYAAMYDWIELVKKPEHKDRQFAAKVQAINAGLVRLKDVDYDVIGNLDADITFDEPDYFQFLMNKFSENPKLGVCGTAYREDNVIYPYAFTSLEDVFGACQMFRRECFEAIGGYLPIPSGGIDVVAVFSAQAQGWETRTFVEKTCEHHRAVNSAQVSGQLGRILNEGRKDYLLGSHPIWELSRSVYRMKNSPRLIGGMLLCAGYFWPAIRRVQKTIPEDLMRLRRKQQMTRLKNILQRYSPLRSSRSAEQTSIAVR